MHDVAGLQIQTYSGWSNRETWLVNLWLTSEPYLYGMPQHIIKVFETISEQAEELEHYIREDENVLTNEASMWSDLLEVALDRVSWYEIIENNQ